MRIRPVLSVCVLSLLCLACEAETDVPPITPDTPTAELPASMDLLKGIPLGTEIVVLRADNTELRGRAVMVLQQDGTRVPGVFRGPAKLADAVSGGTHEFRVGQHARVHELVPGDSIRAIRPVS